MSAFYPLRTLAGIGTIARMVDLAEIVVVNESRDESTAGDVTIFRNAKAACSWLEHWWVAEAQGSAFTASGDRLILGVDERNAVVVTGREATQEGATLVQNWLRTAATAVLEARRAKAARGKRTLSAFEREGRLPISIEELITYVGFTG